MTVHFPKYRPPSGPQPLCSNPECGHVRFWDGQRYWGACSMECSDTLERGRLQTVIAQAQKDWEARLKLYDVKRASEDLSRRVRDRIFPSIEAAYQAARFVSVDETWDGRRNSLVAACFSTHPMSANDLEKVGGFCFIPEEKRELDSLYAEAMSPKGECSSRALEDWARGLAAFFLCHSSNSLHERMDWDVVRNKIWDRLIKESSFDDPSTVFLMPKITRGESLSGEDYEKRIRYFAIAVFLSALFFSIFF